MKKFIYIFMVLLLMTTWLFAGRNTDDAVTASNSAYNNYIQDVVGNKTDTIAGDSLVSLAKIITVEVGSNQTEVTIISGNVLTNKAEIRVIDALVDQLTLEVGTNKIEIRVIDGIVDQITLEVGTNKTEIRVIDGLVDQLTLDVGTNQTELRVIDSIVDQLTLDVGTNQAEIMIISTNIITNKTEIRVIDGLVDQITLEVNTNQTLLVILSNQNDVPTADSADNVHMRDVIGNKTDTHDGDSIYAFIDAALEHMHNQSRVWPTGGDGTNVVSSTASWSVSNNYTNEIIPASRITSDFDIHFISIEAISANGVYELALWNMTTQTLIGTVRFTKNANLDAVMNVPIQTPIQAANSKIGGKLLSSPGTQDTVTVSLFYHTY